MGATFAMLLQLIFLTSLRIWKCSMSAAKLGAQQQASYVR
jgi:hypothetical protein